MYSQSRLIKRTLSETTWIFKDDGLSRLFSLLFIAIKIPVLPISNFRKLFFLKRIVGPDLRNCYQVTLQDSKSKLPIIM